MKLNRRCGMLLAVLASIGMGTAVSAYAQSDTASSSASGTSGMHHGTHHHRAGPGARRQGAMMGHSMLLGTTLRATRQLHLTAAQKSRIRTILHNAHEQERSSMQSGGRPDMAVLGDPTNPGYSAAIASLKTNAANRIQMESDLQGQIVNVLTPEQKAKLPDVLASLQAKHEARHMAAERRSAGSLR